MTRSLMAVGAMAVLGTWLLAGVAPADGRMGVAISDDCAREIRGGCSTWNSGSVSCDRSLVDHSSGSVECSTASVSAYVDAGTPGNDRQFADTLKVCKVCGTQTCNYKFATTDLLRCNGSH